MLVRILLLSFLSLSSQATVISPGDATLEFFLSTGHAGAVSPGIIGLSLKLPGSEAQITGSIEPESALIEFAHEYELFSIFGSDSAGVEAVTAQFTVNKDSILKLSGFNNSGGIGDYRMETSTMLFDLTSDMIVFSEQETIQNMPESLLSSSVDITLRLLANHTYDFTFLHSVIAEESVVFVDGEGGYSLEIVVVPLPATIFLLTMPLAWIGSMQENKSNQLVKSKSKNGGP